VHWVYLLGVVLRKKGQWTHFLCAYFILLALIIAFYMLKKLIGVNYPEDRTGLFFYVLFMLSLVFMFDGFNKPVGQLAIAFPLIFLFHFISNLNFSVHCWRIYETIPQSFFDRLVSEQSTSERQITVAGHRVREFIYGFQNYNSNGKLTHITAPEALQMNCDYAIAYEQDKPYYNR
ncbi:MAG TPA: hypothetical protein VEB42_14820, partial [Chitinophagaceae bacterium]|nr:hypothetical protein [Chitinophagaceae bacterium]